MAVNSFRKELKTFRRGISTSFSHDKSSTRVASTHRWVTPTIFWPVEKNSTAETLWVRLGLRTVTESYKDYCRSLRSIQYPASKYILQHVHSVTKAYEAVLDVPMPAIYGVGAKEPAFLGNAPMNKTVVSTTCLQYLRLRLFVCCSISQYTRM